MRYTPSNRRRKGLDVTYSCENLDGYFLIMPCLEISLRFLFTRNGTYDDKARMINATQIRVGYILKIDGNLFRVLKVVHITPGKGNAQIQADLRNIKTGIKTNMRFRSVESVELVESESRKVTFLYQDGPLYHFMDPENFDQFEFTESFLEDVLRYLKPEATFTLLSCDGENISISLPQRMSFTVVTCDPPSKGMAGATKDATMDNGAVFKVPLFIKPGDVVLIDTETGDYFEKG